MILGLAAVVGCSSSGSLQAPSSDLETARELELVQEAAQVALKADGYRDVEVGRDGGKVVVTARRPGAAATPFGLSAEVVCVPGDPIRVEYSTGGFSIVPLGSTGSELRRKLEGQLSQALAAAGPRGPASGGRDRPKAPDPGPSMPGFSGHRHVLIVGVSEYEDSLNFSNLPSAIHDAKALQDFFRSPAGGDVPTSRIHVLLNRDADRASILAKIRRIAEEARDTDLIVLYFACHGEADGDRRYLIPFDANSKTVRETAIDREEIVERLDEGRAQRQLLMLDCCFAGRNTAAEETRAPPIPAGEEPFSVLSSTAVKKRAVLTSTRGNETAKDSVDGSRLSPFATQLLAALSGTVPAVDENRDGVIQSGELAEYLYLKVSEVSDSRMHPQLYGPGDLPVMELRRR